MQIYEAYNTAASLGSVFDFSHLPVGCSLKTTFARKENTGNAGKN